MNIHDFNLQAKNVSFECTSKDGKYWNIKYQAITKEGVVIPY